MFGNLAFAFKHSAIIIIIERSLHNHYSNILLRFGRGACKQMRVRAWNSRIAGWHGRRTKHGHRSLVRVTRRVSPWYSLFVFLAVVASNPSYVEVHFPFMPSCIDMILCMRTVCWHIQSITIRRHCLIFSFKFFNQTLTFKIGSWSYSISTIERQLAMKWVIAVTTGDSSRQFRRKYGGY